MGVGKCNGCNEPFKETAPRLPLAFALIGGASLTLDMGHFSHQTSKPSTWQLWFKKNKRKETPNPKHTKEMEHCLFKQVEDA